MFSAATSLKLQCSKMPKRFLPTCRPTVRVQQNVPELVTCGAQHHHPKHDIEGVRSLNPTLSFYVLVLRHTRVAHPIRLPEMLRYKKCNPLPWDGSTVVRSLEVERQCEPREHRTSSVTYTPIAWKLTQNPTNSARAHRAPLCVTIKSTYVRDYQ